MILSPKYDYFIKELFHEEIVLRYFIQDILSLSMEQVRSVRLRNTFLRRSHRKKKLGILDIVADLNDNTKLNIEMQIRFFKAWDKRQLFYLCKLFTEDLLTGQDYSRLCRCIGISLLDFNLSEREEYHSIYRLRDSAGNEFSDALEIHVLELKKQLTGQNHVDDWIRFFNIETEGDIKMLKSRTKNPGILTAIQTLQRMSLSNPLRLWYEAYMKKLRDDRAWRAYVQEQSREEGLAEGKAKGLAEGLAEGKAEGLAEGKAEGKAEGLAEGITTGEFIMLNRLVKNNTLTIENAAQMQGITVEEFKRTIQLLESRDIQSRK